MSNDNVTSSSAKRGTAKLLRKIERAKAADQIEQCRRLTRIYMRFHDAKVGPAAEAGLPIDRAKYLGFVTDTPVPTRAWRDPKKNRGYRQLAAFNRRDKANQIFIRTVLEALHTPDPAQYSRAGRGRERCAEAVRDAINGGKTWGAVLDIRGCYDHWTHEGLLKLLPLPRAVTSAFILKNQDTWNRVNRGAGKGGNNPKTNEVAERRQRGRQRNRRHHLLRRPNMRRGNGNDMRHECPYVKGCFTGRVNPVAAQQGKGIWQGAAISPLVSEMMIAVALRALPEGAWVVVYGDDIIVLAESRDEVRTHVSILRDAFLSHPAGPVKLKIGDVVPMTVGLDYIGFNLRVERGSAVVRPHHNNRTKLTRKIIAHLDPMLARAPYHPPDPDKIDALLKSVYGWAQSFRIWPRAHAYVERRIRDLFGLPPGNGDLRTRLIEHLTA